MGEAETLGGGGGGTSPPPQYIEPWKSQNRRSFSMLSILKMLNIFAGSRDPHGPDLPFNSGENSTLHLERLKQLHFENTLDRQSAWEKKSKQTGVWND